MKSFFHLTIALFFIIPVLHAQTDTTNSSQFLTKKGIVVGPEKGDVALGIDAAPFLEYIGNIFKISDQINPAPRFGFTAQNPGMVYLKFMRSDTRALGLAFRLGFSREVDKDGTGFNNTEADKYIESAANIGLQIDMERSPFMKSRLRGYYGWSAAVALSPWVGESYANPGVTLVGSYKFRDATSESFNFVERGGNTISAGVGGFAGIEYFITRKLSLSGQFNLMLTYAYQLPRNYNPETGSEVVVDVGEWSVSMDNMASGSLKLMCYF